MADEPISALTLFTSYSLTADGVEILDVSDTTFASTGTNKRIPFSTLLTMAGVGTGSGGGMTNPMTTAGDTIYGGASGTPERLPIGTSGQVYSVASGSPAWAAPVTETVDQFGHVFRLRLDHGNILERRTFCRAANGRHVPD